MIVILTINDNVYDNVHVSNMDEAPTKY